MGENKALLTFGNVPLAVHMAQLLRSVCRHVIAIVNDDEVKDILDVPCYSDIIKDAGPLGGLHAACRHSPTERFLTVPCDTPMISPDLLRYLWQFSGFGNIVVPYSEGRIHPLTGVYSRTLEVRIQRALGRGVRSMNQFIEGQHPVVVDINTVECEKAVQLANLNTKEEYARCIAQRQRQQYPRL